ncbi:virulence factor TspB C-terminal domain-related protein [Herbaspirillum sp. SJZ099]|uniref:virulence factor TspB C-terminal domain-related protein n=1 Tax=Herbaspirillum sp. SJZ099 TaxID=2572916 RepID=UPI0011A5AAB6|nr:virulence factor TspB C-terminal domain-related protein [Herbaspirillum sp. SJZ099]TWC67391.1 TspB protein [Herbaspirillum sp. SJZ099]
MVLRMCGDCGCDVLACRFHPVWLSAMCKKIVMAFALVAMLVQQQAAQAQVAQWVEPVFGGAMNRLVARAVRSNLARRAVDVAANDAKFLRTANFIGEAANDASFIAGTAATLFGAPVWASALIGLGALAVVGGVGWGIYTLTQTGTPQKPQFKLTPKEPTEPIDPGSWTNFEERAVPAQFKYYARHWRNSYGVAGCVDESDCAAQYARQWLADPDFFPKDEYRKMTYQVSVYSTGTYQIDVSGETLAIDSDGEQLGWYPYEKTGFASIRRNFAYIGEQEGDLKDLRLAPGMLREPVPPVLLATVVDKLWERAAAQPDYDGLPYEAANPVSEADIASAAPMLSWNDVVQERISPEGSKIIPIGINVNRNSWPDPDPRPDPTPTPSPGLCKLFPFISACAPLGDPPPDTPALPSSSTEVSMTPWKIGPANGACPAPKVVTILDKDYSFSFDPLCSVVRDLRPLVLALCALGAVLIVALGVAA